MRVKVTAIASALPEQVVTSAAVEQRLTHHNPDLFLIPGLVKKMTGIETRRYADDTTNTSDLAAQACRNVLAQANVGYDEVDLLIFASAFQDLIEPATSHIVQSKLGTRAAVMDVKNACNSFINGLQVAESLIQTGQYHTALVAVGEVPSRCIKWHVNDLNDLRLSFPGYTFGDAGAAALLQPTSTSPGIYYRRFWSMSQHWGVSGLMTGGSMHLRGDDYTYFRGDGAALKQAFLDVSPTLFHEALHDTNTSFSDYRRIFVHQVTMDYLDTFLRVARIPADRVVTTLPHYGNMAAATLPVGFDLCQSRAGIQRGDKVMFIGLAGGISVGLMMFEY
jgi:acyl-CoA:acyl-CoA alkyltransferase